MQFHKIIYLCIVSQVFIVLMDLVSTTVLNVVQRMCEKSINKTNFYLPIVFSQFLSIYPSVNFTLQMVQINPLTNVLPLQNFPMCGKFIYMTGFGITCIVHTSNFSTLETHKIYLE